jgi:2-methylcitrate dehydratase PrpD
LEAKFSIEFVTSCAIIAREVTLNQLTDKFVLRKDVQSLIRKVKVSNDVELDPRMTYGAAVYDQAHVRLKSGVELHGPQVRRPYGHFENPLNDTELFNKFKSCLRAGKATVTLEHLSEQLQFLEQTRARALTKLPALSAQLGQ